MQGSIHTIKPYVDEFIAFALEHRHLIFLVTEIGRGIAGFTPCNIAPLSRIAVDKNAQNIYIPESFYNYYKR